MEQPNQYLDISKTASTECSECGGIFFDQTFLVRQVSKFYTTTGRDEPLPIPVFICRDCNTPLKQYFPNIPDAAEKLGLTPKIQIQA